MYIKQFPVLEDNYIYLLRDEVQKLTAVVDPAVSEAVVNFLREKNWNLDFILNTHHHRDHVGANLYLKQLFSCQIVGPRADASRIPGIDTEVGTGEEFHLGDFTAKVFDIPGHTKGHIAYYFESENALFCGDTIFSLGCGKVFDGTAEQLWHSLNLLRQLPGATRIYCAHEYTLDNARFALTLESENENLLAMVERAQALRAAAKPTIPSLLSDECAANPFLRPESKVIQEKLNMVGKPLAQIFAVTRETKDRFDRS